MSIDEYTHKITICPDAVYIRNEKSTNTIYITMKDLEVKYDSTPNFVFLSVNNQKSSYDVLGVAEFEKIRYLLFITKRKLITKIVDKPIYKILDVDFCPLIKDFDYNAKFKFSNELLTFINVIKKSAYYSPGYDLSKIFSQQNQSGLAIKYDTLNKDFMNDGILWRFYHISRKYKLTDFIAVCIFGYVESFTKTVFDMKIEIFSIARRCVRNPKTMLTQYEIIGIFGNSKVFNYYLYGIGSDYIMSSLRREPEKYEECYTKLKNMINDSMKTSKVNNVMVISTSRNVKDMSEREGTFKALFDKCVAKSYLIDQENIKNVEKTAEKILNDNYMKIVDYDYSFTEIGNANHISNQKGVIIIACPDGFSHSVQIVKYISYEMLTMSLSHFNQFKKPKEILGNLSNFANMKEEEFNKIMIESQSEYEKEDLTKFTLPDTMLYNGSLVHSSINDEAKTNANLALITNKPNIDNIFNKGYKDLFNICIKLYPQFESDDYKTLPVLFLPSAQKDKLKKVLPSLDKEHIPDKLKVYIATWNICAFNKEKSFDESKLNLTELLFPTKFGDVISEDNRPDLFIIGFQEVVKLKTSNAIKTLSADNYNFWLHFIEKQIGPNYAKLDKIEMYGILLLAFIKKEYKPYLRMIDEQRLKTGFHGLCGNKGSCVLQFEIFDTKFGFSNGHYACGEENNEKRKNDLKAVISAKNEISDNFPKNFIANDCWFIFGDLNFRIELPKEDCMFYIDKRNIIELRKHDQLLNLLKEKSVINAKEAEINFLPTFKLIKGTNDYNLQKRVPSWCDRIIYSNTDRITCLKYDSLNVNYSDHHPVAGLFEIKLPK